MFASVLKIRKGEQFLQLVGRRGGGGPTMPRLPSSTLLQTYNESQDVDNLMTVTILSI